MSGAIQSRLSDLRTTWSFLRGLGPFFGQHLDAPTSRTWLTQRLEMRERSFAAFLEAAVFANARSPYRKLLNWARIELGDVQGYLKSEGLDATLQKLHGAGIFVTLDEVKGRHTIKRSGLELAVTPEDFDNPLGARRYGAETSGSSGKARRIRVDLELVEQEAAYHCLLYEAAGLRGRPAGVWHPAPPGAVGIKTALIHARLGWPLEKWFSPSDPWTSVQQGMFLRATISMAGLHRETMPWPEFVPVSEASRVSDWLSSRWRRGTSPLLVTTPSSAVRVCQAAESASQDISGTVFILVGEPYTEAKATVVRRAGARAFGHYAMAESGMIGLACPAGDDLDAVHPVLDKVATIQREVTRPDGQTIDNALFHTTLLPTAPKVMLNVESGDCAITDDRDCGCGTLPYGYHRRLHSIRSYEKLTSEGMSFLGADLVDLVERELPARFGGYPTHYQFVEREVAGLPKVSLRISPAAGEVDSAEVVRTVIEFWRKRGLGEEIMAGIWTHGDTLRVERDEPYVTKSGKTPPLQVLLT